MTPCRRVRNDQLATLKQPGGRRRRPSGLWSIWISGDRCGDAVGFSLSKGGNATDAGRRKGIGRKSRGNSCQRKHPPEILALGPSCASRRRSSNANSLGGQNSAGSLEICATFQWIICAAVSEFESYMPRSRVSVVRLSRSWAFRGRACRLAAAPGAPHPPRCTTEPTALKC
jgi:hypothetical protein